MTERIQNRMNAGHISGKAFNAVLAKTKVQPSKMIKFDSKVKDEGDKDFDGHEHFGVNQINSKATQKTRAMPSKGGRVNAGGQPNREQIDRFPGSQGRTFPKGTGVKAQKGFTGNTRMKGPKPKRSGLYGDNNSRSAG